MTRSERPTVSDDLNKYCPIAKVNDFIEITEWSNGEGWDVTINDRHFHLTHGELEAINFLTKFLEYGEGI
jgi:hypothetical protein